MNTDQDYRNWQREQLDQRKKMKTRDELYELDRTQLLTEIEKASGIKIGEDFYNADLQLSTWCTADGYDIYVLMNGKYMSDMNWESDVYYYQPSLEDILDRLKDLDEGDQFYVDDVEEYFTDEDAMIDYLIDQFPDEYVEDEIDIIIKESGE